MGVLEKLSGPGSPLLSLYGQVVGDWWSCALCLLLLKIECVIVL